MDEDVKRVVKFNAKRDEDYNLGSMRLESLLESRGLLDILLQETSSELTSLQSSGEYKSTIARARSLIV